MSPSIRIRITHVIITILVLTTLTSCFGTNTSDSTDKQVSSRPPEQQEVILATTTSTYDSGLLDEIIPLFEQQTGYLVKIIAVGTGKALKMGEDGNADILLVHAPNAEIEFMDSDFGVDRRLIMHNDFVFVGPEGDPAKVNELTSPKEVLATIAITQEPFISRGDDSGTHKKELTFWEASGLSPSSNEAWYFETGQGMGATLRIASEKGGYTLTDRATYFAQQDTLDLSILVEGDSSLLNVYHSMVVNPNRWPEVNQKGAAALSDFFVSDDVQKLIGEFGIDRYGQPLFFPDAGKTDADFGLGS